MWSSYKINSRDVFRGGEGGYPVNCSSTQTAAFPLRFEFFEFGEKVMLRLLTNHLFYNGGCSSSVSHKPRALTAQAEPATMMAAKSGGTNMSILERWKRRAARQKSSDGMSSGNLTEPCTWHAWDNGEDGLMAETKAHSGVKDATATVAVRMDVQATA